MDGWNRKSDQIHSILRIFETALTLVTSQLALWKIPWKELWIFRCCCYLTDIPYEQFGLVVDQKKKVASENETVAVAT